MTSEYFCKKAPELVIGTECGWGPLGGIVFLADLERPKHLFYIIVRCLDLSILISL